MRFELAAADGKKVAFTTHLTPSEVELLGTAPAAASGAAAVGGAKAGGAASAGAAAGSAYAKHLAAGEVFEVRCATTQRDTCAWCGRGAFVRRPCRLGAAQAWATTLSPRLTCCAGDVGGGFRRRAGVYGQAGHSGRGRQLVWPVQRRAPHPAAVHPARAPALERRLTRATHPAVFKPTFVAAAKAHAGKALFLSCIGDANGSTAKVMKRLAIKAVPSFLGFKNGESVFQFSGAKKELLEEKLAAHV